MTAVASSTLTGLRLLIVEDEYMVAEYISVLLENFGCNVAGPVATIEEAVAIVEDGVLDGALLDANLDGDSSAPIALALHAASVPFVVVTGYGACDLADEILNCAPRIVKPFKTAEFKETLVAAFTRQTNR